MLSVRSPNTHPLAVHRERLHNSASEWTQRERTERPFRPGRPLPAFHPDPERFRLSDGHATARILSIRSPNTHPLAVHRERLHTSASEWTQRERTERPFHLARPLPAFHPDPERFRFSDGHATARILSIRSPNADPLAVHRERLHTSASEWTQRERT